MLARIRARQFRNLGLFDWSPAAGSNLILGRNGAGKTSLLEAVYLAATTRSFRTARPEECRRHGSEGFYLDLDVGESGRTRLELSVRPGERQRRVNEVELPLVEHLRQLPLVLWTAAEKELLTGGPEVGRRVLDRGVVSRNPTELRPLGRYRRALRQKRQLVASSRDLEALDGWNRVLAESAAEVISARARYVEFLDRALAEVMEEIDMGLPRPSLRYRSSPSMSEVTPDNCLAGLREVASREMELGRVLLGPHRDSLRFFWGDRELRSTGSAGELKAIGLLLVAAQGRVLAQANRDPLFLLDDFDTELDGERLQRVWTAFGPDRQVIVTSSRPADWRVLDFSARWKMEEGRLTSGEVG
ncbi:MAG: DNA replication and repair protein RecF [Thermoanaerobaculia bacterium]|nr:DNA replication and repair protein RecF [Thermoanaerobaculia bacterium]